MRARLESLKPSRGQTTAPIDHTKTRTFAVVDLVTKVASAVALAALGLAGWCFQVQTERTRHAAQQRDEQERVYLPTFRALTELELVLDDAARQLRTALRDGSDIAARDILAYDIGNRIRVAGTTLTFPRPRGSGRPVDPEYFVQFPSRSRRPFGEPAPLRGTTLMLSELLRAPYALRLEPTDGTTYIELAERGVIQVVRGNIRSTFPARPETLPAWRACLRSGPLTAADLRSEKIIWFIEDVRLRVAEAAHDLVEAHPQLGEKYVEVRTSTISQFQKLGEVERHESK